MASKEEQQLQSSSMVNENLKRLNLEDNNNNKQQTISPNMAATTIFGKPINDYRNSLTVGPRGPILLQDVQFLEELAHFDRERIPERVVHAKGAGAFGYFQVTSTEITKYCRAKVFEEIGKRTPVAVRFSTVGGESGSADTVRDPRGFAVKFYTEEGNWDLVGNNTPIFFIRDPRMFPVFIHTQKRNPQTHLKDANMFWDFFSLVPAATHQFTFLFSDRGIPDGYRHMNGYGSHTFKLVNADGQPFYTKFHFKTQQGIKNLDVKTATQLAGEDPDYAINDLFNAISQKNYPKWKLFVQIMTYDQAKNFKYDPFDLTKVWSHKEYPLIEVGEMVLDRNAENYFAEIEQLAFCPANMVPGIEPSPDRMLLGRMFSYTDTQRHRLGANFHQIPVNKPKCPVMNPTIRDGPCCVDGNYGSKWNYWPNSKIDLKLNPSAKDHCDQIDGLVDRFDTTREDDDYSQVTEFWLKVLNDEERERLVKNIADHMKNADMTIQQKAVGHFEKVHPDFGSRLRLELNLLKPIMETIEVVKKSQHANLQSSFTNAANQSPIETIANAGKMIDNLTRLATFVQNHQQLLKPICCCVKTLNTCSSIVDPNSNNNNATNNNPRNKRSNINNNFNNSTNNQHDDQCLALNLLKKL